MSNQDEKNSEDHPAIEWKECPSGELSKMVKQVRLRSQQQRQHQRITKLTNAGLATALSLLIVVLGWSYWVNQAGNPQPLDTFPQAVNCKQFKDLYPAMQAGNLTPKQVKVLENHLTRCNSCQTWKDHLEHALLDVQTYVSTRLVSHTPHSQHGCCKHPHSLHINREHANCEHINCEHINCEHAKCQHFKCQNCNSHSEARIDQTLTVAHHR